MGEVCGVQQGDKLCVHIAIITHVVGARVLRLQHHIDVTRQVGARSPLAVRARLDRALDRDCGIVALHDLDGGSGQLKKGSE